MISHYSKITLLAFTFYFTNRISDHFSIKDTMELYSYLWQTLKLFQTTCYCTKYLIISRFGKIFDTGKISKYINTVEHYKTTTKFQAPNLRFRLALVHQQKHNKI